MQTCKSRFRSDVICKRHLCCRRVNWQYAHPEGPVINIPSSMCVFTAALLWPKMRHELHLPAEIDPALHPVVCFHSRVSRRQTSVIITYKVTLPATFLTCILQSLLSFWGSYLLLRHSHPSPIWCIPVLASFIAKEPHLIVHSVKRP